MTKTDNPHEIGLHVFERAGLGKAPFQFTGMYEKVYQACQGAPIQPGSSCDYCGQGIRYCCAIIDATGKEFKVGSDCVRKTGDAGLLKAYKKSPEKRALDREKAKARDTATIDAWNALWADPATEAAFADEEFTRWEWGKERGQKIYHVETPKEHFARIWAWCGAAGRRRWLKQVKLKVAEKKGG